MPQRSYTIKQRILKIKRRFKFVRGKFVYNEKRKDFLRKTNKIDCYFLVFNTPLGHSVFEFTFRRAEAKNHAGWKIWLDEKGLDIFSGAVLEAINVRDGSGKTDYHLIDLICWSFQYDFQKLKHTKTFKKGYHEKQTRKTKKSRGHRR